MARGLTDVGVDVHVATTDDNGPLDRLDVPLNQPVEEAGVTYWYFRRQTTFYVASAPLTRWLWQHIAAYDLVHIHGLFTYASIPSALIAYQRGIPYIVRPFGVLNRWGMHKSRPRMKRLSLHFIDRHIMEHAAYVQFTSDQERIEAEELGVPFKSVVHPLGVDLEPFAQLPERSTFRNQHPMLAKKHIILFLSRLHVKKGLDLLLPAFAEVLRARPDTALVLAGEGDPAYLQSLRTQARALNIEQHVLFPGFVEGTQKLALLHDSDIFVLPSYSENFGIVIVEAMACRLPVVISDQIGIAQEIQCADAGIMVECQQGMISRSLLHLLESREDRERIAARGLQFAHEHYSMQAVTNFLVSLYNDIIQHHQQDLS
jgi:glycosyltransferase involved in cell wall biosynthesis